MLSQKIHPYRFDMGVYTEELFVTGNLECVWIDDDYGMVSCSGGSKCHSGS